MSAGIGTEMQHEMLFGMGRNIFQNLKFKLKHSQALSNHILNLVKEIVKYIFLSIFSTFSEYDVMELQNVIASLAHF